MNIQILSGTALDADVELCAIVVNGDPKKDALVKAADSWLDGAIAAAATAESFKGKRGQTLLVSTRGDLAPRYIGLVGAGDKKNFSAGEIRHAAARAVRLGARVNAAAIALVMPAAAAKAAEGAAQLAAEGAVLGAYGFRKYRSGDSGKPHPTKKVLLAPDRRSSTGKALAAGKRRTLGRAIKRGVAVASATANARDLINEPAAAMTPTKLASAAKAIGKKHNNVTVKVLSAAECQKMGMGMFLAVGRGSDEPVKFVHMTYKPAKKAKRRIALVGKGVTFDSGGYSLKPSASMLDMKVDMSGAAAVISAMDAIGTIGSNHEVHAIAACAENLVSGNAYKLGDVLEAMDGTTVEINNTDAEGRLTLGDAITYARTKVQADEIIDFATLTGACVVALGPNTAAVMSNSETQAKDFLKASDRAGESVWRLPLLPRLRDQLKSPIADMRNTGERYGGAITAGLFLKNFAKDSSWVHVDIAGPSTASRAYGAHSRGGTGFAVASIVEYVCG